MTKTKRLKAPCLSSRLEFERCIDDLARTTVALRRLEARRDEQLQKVRTDYDPAVSEAAARVASLTLIAEKYAEEHRAELLPGKEKSAQTALAIFGFRLGPPTLKLLSRQWSWEKVLEALKERKLTALIRVKHEPDKDAMKAQLDAGQLAAVGCRSVQDDAFFVEPKEQPSEEARVA